uniref:Nitroreductase n=1 Tax=uncultured bacterium Contig248 TaxID=1393544 RepID=W0FNZ6_9BACT|nr:nitroreductase [uncultured bacterium Contig248]
MKQQMAMRRYGIKHIFNNVNVIKGGQQTNYAILQLAHRLEKGLCIRDPRAGWGFDKANKLVDQILKEKDRKDPDAMALSVGTSVIAAYISAKEESKDPKDVSELQKLKEKAGGAGLEQGSGECGGSLLLHKEDMLQDEKAVERLFLTRHSVRDFDDTPVDREKLERAVALALRAPSACNRQASQIYVISGEDRVKAGGGNEYHADKYLIITGNMRAFSLSELNDWIVSTSVFCGYLSLALHAEGIGSCVFRKDIIKDSKYNDSVRSMCHIPEDEQIILEMAVGNYKEEFKVPVSFRRKPEEVIHYLP